MNAREQAAFDILAATVSDMALSLKEACSQLADPPQDVIPLKSLPGAFVDYGAAERKLETVMAAPIFTEDDLPAIEGMNFEVDLKDGALEVRSTAKSYHIPAPEFYSILSRAINTLEPHKMPQWALEIHDRLWSVEGTVKLVIEAT